jgi:HEAT repeat protein
MQSGEFKVNKFVDEAFDLDVGLNSAVGRAPERAAPQPLTDSQVRFFLANGFLTLKPRLPESFHARMFESVRDMFGADGSGNPGNNLLPLEPALRNVIDDPVVKGAVTSIVGDDYWLHPHRFPHENPPGTEEQVWHHDSYWGYKRKVHDHRPWWVMVMYYPQAVTRDIGPTDVAAGSYCLAKRSVAIDAMSVPTIGDAGTCTMIHYDIWHRKMKNFSERERFMVKFEFARMSRPRSIMWNCDDTAWREPEDLPLFPVPELYRQQWYWLGGKTPPRLDNAESGAPLRQKISTLGEGSIGDRRDAAVALGRMGASAVAAIPALAEAVRAEDESLSLNAAYALSAVGEPAIPALIELMRGNDGENVDDPRVLVDEGQHAEVEMTARNAAHALASLEAPAALALVELVRDAGPRVRKYAVYAVGQIGWENPAVYDMLEAGARDDDAYVRINAIEALGLMTGRAKTTTVLLEALRDEEDEVRFNAVQSIARLAPKDPSVISALKDALYDGNRYVVGYALEALERIGTPHAISLLIPHLKDSRWCPMTSPRSQF